MVVISCGLFLRAARCLSSCHALVVSVIFGVTLYRGAIRSRLAGPLTCSYHYRAYLGFAGVSSYMDLSSSSRVSGYLSVPLGGLLRVVLSRERSLWRPAGGACSGDR
jgi:hypothetical protein